MQFDKKEYEKTLNLLKQDSVYTVCIEANCPNRYECFAKKTATFMVLGNICTRNCKYCNVKKGTPDKLDLNEPKKILNIIRKLNLKYVVITSVTRDDLKDGGAKQFVKIINSIKEYNSNIKVEVLISDLNGNFEALNEIIKANPDVINHNIETVERLFDDIRPNSNYQTSIKILKQISNSKIICKSGIMVGLGETKEDLEKTLTDLKNSNVDVLTIGQYLKPNTDCKKVDKYYTEKDFLELKQLGEKYIPTVISGQLVRSSYKADSIFEKII